MLRPALAAFVAAVQAATSGGGAIFATTDADEAGAIASLMGALGVLECFHNVDRVEGLVVPHLEGDSSACSGGRQRGADTATYSSWRRRRSTPR